MIKLLIVDDDQMNCDLLQNVFTRQGYHVMTATSGREGLDLFVPPALESPCWIFECRRWMDLPS
ncbi:MAG: response regulator [Nitrospira sp.]|nr:response regulator [Nitrospira sp.]